jgi:hypothetical protein
LAFICFNFILMESGSRNEYKIDLENAQLYIYI